MAHPLCYSCSCNLLFSSLLFHTGTKMRLLHLLLLLLFHFHHTLSAPILEYHALLSLRSSINAATPPVLSSWNNSTNRYSFSGVTYDSRRHITALILTGLGLSGTLS